MDSGDVHYLNQVHYDGTSSSSSSSYTNTAATSFDSSDPSGILSTPLSGIMKSMASPSSIHVYDDDGSRESYDIMLRTLMSQSSSPASSCRIHPTVNIYNGSSCSISSSLSFGPSFQLDQHSLQRSYKKVAGGSTKPMPPRPDSTRKCRLNAPPSCPSLKVRKEKLGDRIASLQQLVAPYGKTDTTTVLTEAIRYIKCLQDQVQALSVPYTRANNTAKQQRGDLGSVGLCLVPLSCMSYVENARGFAGAVWPPF